ncbi:MAG: beta-CASP ribonuclease aCPSF1, partial [Candidatus Heimdallarchaeota archaeon]|nr:beta-CASP ribonuclease aCPSF1 [Candidatus Heimdallarchaeota archaeon]MCK5049673.1 beta-CASP ribonuclease aCPSF1 [Candidatus Heimdallarchaeota archaeon]
QLDYLDVAKKEGKLLPYSQNDVKKCALHTVTLNYGEVTDIAPDLKLTLHNAGHIAGSAIVHLHIGDGQYNIAWARDFKFARSRLLDRAVSKFPRLEALFLESTYGNSNDRLPSRRDCEKELENIINETITRGGKILIPVLAVGRAQEVMIILEQMIRQKKIPMIPIYIDGLVQEATAVTTAHPEFLSRSLKDRIFNAGANPFLAESFQPVEGSEARSEIVMGDPCIIIATSGMLAGGPSVQYFKDLCGDEKNAMIFVSYQGRNTLGSRVQRGLREVIIYESGKNRSYRINFSIHSITGFTGHSDRRELIEYSKQVSPRPKIYLTVHGEERKCLNLASSIHRATGRETIAPHVGQTVVFK